MPKRGAEGISGSAEGSIGASAEGSIGASIGGSGKAGKVLYACGLDAAVDVVGGKWKPMILWALHAGTTLRFGELRRHITGISEKVLIQQLRELQSDGIVHREVYREVPPKVEYSLTSLGLSLNEALVPLGVWGDDHMRQLVANKEAGRGACEGVEGVETCQGDAEDADGGAKKEGAAA